MVTRRPRSPAQQPKAAGRVPTAFSGRSEVVYLSARSREDGELKDVAESDAEPLSANWPEPVFVRQRTMLATLVDDWDEMTSEERRHLIGTVFAEVYADKDGISKMLPREDWKPYMAAVLRTPAALERWGTERKTGVKRAEVITARLVQDERGWLRLAV